MHRLRLWKVHDIVTSANRPAAWNDSPKVSKRPPQLTASLLVFRMMPSPHGRWGTGRTMPLADSKQAIKTRRREANWMLAGVALEPEIAIPRYRWGAPGTCKRLHLPRIGALVPFLLGDAGRVGLAFSASNLSGILGCFDRARQSRYLFDMSGGFVRLVLGPRQLWLRFLKPFSNCRLPRHFGSPWPFTVPTPIRWISCGTCASCQVSCPAPNRQSRPLGHSECMPL
jgi:hypothetical protein